MTGTTTNTTTPKKKAKRLIKALDFSQEGSAVSLVGTSLGGAANNFTVLISKSKNTEANASNQSEPDSSGDEPSIVQHEGKQGESSSVDNLNKGKEMQVKEDEEMIEKSQLVSLQKAMQEKEELLLKAQALVAEFEKDKQEQIVKSKTAKITAVIKDQAQAVPITKAALELKSDEDFDAFVNAITSVMQALSTAQEYMEKSLTQEKGITVSSEDKAPEESGVAKILKARSKQ